MRGCQVHQGKSLGRPSAPLKSLVFLLWVVGVFLLMATTQAARANVASGLGWLQAQIEPAGYLASENASIGYPMQARSETAITLNATGSSVSAPLLSAIDNDSASTVEDTARKTIARQISGADDTALLNALASMQNTDGGFGIARGFSSSATDTAWALMALAKSRSISTTAANALAWLVSNQRSTGQWTDVPDGDEIIPTALVIQALHLYRGQSGISTVLSKARTWLAAQQAGNTWGDDARSAQSLLAILPSLSDTSAIQPALDALAARQGADGSWSGDPYTTALAVRALFIASQPYTNPDLVSINGQVIDDATGNPVVGAAIRLTNAGQQVLSDAQGNFAFSALTAGAETLSINAAGYRPLTSSLSLQAGQTLNLGAIRLTKATSGATDVILQGTVRYFNGSSYVAASNATIQVGALSTQSDSSGAYQFSNIPAGTFLIAVSYNGYPSVTATVTAVSGSVVAFNPVLEPAAANASTLQVVVTDSATKAGLSGVVVTLQPANTSRTTDAVGTVNFSTGIVAGVNTVIVTRAGYQTAIVTVTNNTNIGSSVIEVPVALAPETSFTQAVLKGIITDALSGQPLAGAAVAIEGTAFTTQTDANGRYSFSGSGLTGSRTVAMSMTGYTPYTQTFTISPSGTTVFDVPLMPLRQTGNSSLHGHVIDDVTGNPVTSAIIYLTAAGQRAFADVQGNFSFSGLAAGTEILTVAASGYRSQILPITLQDGQDLNLGTIRMVAGAADVTITCTSDSSVFNTGANGSGGILAVGSIDSHWQVSVPGLVNSALIPGDPDAVPAADWVPAIVPTPYPTFHANLSNAAWISQTVSAVQTPSSNADVFYRLQFYLDPSVNPATFQLSMNFWADNSVYEVWVNGMPQSGLPGVGTLPQDPTQPYDAAEFSLFASSTLFTFTQGWRTGLNTFIVDTKTSSGLTGLLAQVTTGGLCKPAIHISKTQSSTAALAPGGSVTYKVVASNPGSVDAGAVEVKDDFPAGIASASWACTDNSSAIGGGPYCPVSDSGGVLSPPATLLDQTIGALPPGGAVTYTVTATAAAALPATVVNTATANLPGGGACLDASGNATGEAMPCTATVVTPTSAVAISTSTDKTVYDTNSPVNLSASITNNNGSAPRELNVVLSIEDESGAEVIAFPAQSFGTLASGATAPVSQPWNTASYLAGGYALLGRVFDSSGNLVAYDRTLFAIAPGGATASPIATLTVNTDKAQYLPNDRVLIGDLLRNLTSNAVLDDVRIEIKVFDPGSALIFSYTHNIGQLNANALRTLETPQLLQGVVSGIYTVQATLIGSGQGLVATKSQAASSSAVQTKAYGVDVELATATTRYTVNDSALPIATPTQPIPVNSPLALTALALALACLGAARAQRRKNRHSH